jgi:cytoskeletal protein RodZ
MVILRAGVQERPVNKWVAEVKMDEEGATPETVENEEFRFHTVGEQLHAARTERGLTLNEVAAQTRIPMRHLEAIEKSDFGALPGSTYSIGFAKSYARFVGLDANVVADELRTELAQGGHAGFTPAKPEYEPTDPSRVPPRWLAWTAAIVAILGIAGYALWKNYALSSDPSTIVTAESILPAQPAVEKAKAPVTAAPVATGPVVLTASDTVWIKIYDAENKRLFESEMKAGDSFTVPADANNPMIVTGRPQHLKVTVGGQAVAALGNADITIADVGVSAAALLARKPVEAPAQPPTAPTPAPKQ